MNIRKAKMEDLDEITAIEADCFPASEAARIFWREIVDLS